MRNHVVYSFFPKAVATKFTNVHDLNLKEISLISIAVFSILKKSLEVATALEKTEYTGKNKDPSTLVFSFWAFDLNHSWIISQLSYEKDP